MTTTLVIIGAPGAGPLKITKAQVEGRSAGQAQPSAIDVACSKCPLGKSLTVMISTATSVQTQYVAQRYPESALSSEVQSALPSGAFVLKFSTIQKARDWYLEVEVGLELHVAYFFEDSDTTKLYHEPE